MEVPNWSRRGLRRITAAGPRDHLGRAREARRRRCSTATSGSCCAVSGVWCAAGATATSSAMVWVIMSVLSSTWVQRRSGAGSRALPRACRTFLKESVGLASIVPPRPRSPTLSSRSATGRRGRRKVHQSLRNQGPVDPGVPVAGPRREGDWEKWGWSHSRRWW